MKLILTATLAVLPFCFQAQFTPFLYRSQVGARMNDTINQLGAQLNTNMHSNISSYGAAVDWQMGKLSSKWRLIHSMGLGANLGNPIVSGGYSLAANYAIINKNQRMLSVGLRSGIGAGKWYNHQSQSLHAIGGIHYSGHYLEAGLNAGHIFYRDGYGNSNYPVVLSGYFGGSFYLLDRQFKITTRIGSTYYVPIQSITQEIRWKNKFMIGYSFGYEHYSLLVGAQLSNRIGIYSYFTQHKNFAEYQSVGAQIRMNLKPKN